MASLLFIGTFDGVPRARTTYADSTAVTALGDLTMKILLPLLSLPASAEMVQLDATGTRILSKLPEPGVHPRVLFNAEGLPDIMHALTGMRGISRKALLLIN